MEDLLMSMGYAEVSPGMWQDKHGYQPVKALQDAYDYEMEMFE